MMNGTHRRALVSPGRQVGGWAGRQAGRKFH